MMISGEYYVNQLGVSKGPVSALVRDSSGIWWCGTVEYIRGKDYIKLHNPYRVSDSFVYAWQMEFGV